MLSDLPRPPAYAGMRPSEPAFGAVAPALAAAVKASVPGIGVVDRLVTDAAEDCDVRFLRASRNGETPLFLKMMSEGDFEVATQVAAVLGPLAREFAAASPTGSFPLADGTGRILVAYPYIEARYLAPTTADMGLLGRHIAILHRTMRNLPGRDGIRRRAHDRSRQFDATLRASARLRDALDAASIPAPEAGIEQANEGRDAQPLHGDLNAGNIICERSTNRIHFLDFEDLRHSYGPPVLDLAMPVERFCLLTDDDEQARATACALLRGYADEAGASPIAVAGDLANALRVINERAVALLIQLREAGMDLAQDQWRKFGTLLRRHAERREIIAEIERSVL